MKTLKKIVLMGLMLALVLQTAAMAQDDAGKAAIPAPQAYTNQEMLTYAIEDAYLSQAKYQAYQEAYGENQVFSRLLQAGDNQLARLEALFDTYGYALPENTAAVSVQVPQTLELAYLDNLSLAIQNTGMYKTFLSQSDLPDDLKLVLTALMRVSQNHARAALQQIQATPNLNGAGQGMRGHHKARGFAGQGPQAADPSGKRGQNMPGRFGATPSGGRSSRQNRSEQGPAGIPCHPDCPCLTQTPVEPAAEAPTAPEAGTPGS
ncbi:MAG: hypothetical protein GX781_03595 [Clostridiales bacterium]|nr:hypothetical protein [Clostridiales bacterium]